jgi:hypothetical protein
VGLGGARMGLQYYSVFAKNVSVFAENVFVLLGGAKIPRGTPSYSWAAIWGASWNFTSL